MDIVSIEPGFDFVEAIDEAISGCDVLIGLSWLNAVDEHGGRRLDNPDDLVLLEVKAALDLGIRVIPVLVDGASASRQNELPEVIAGLARSPSVSCRIRCRVASSWAAGSCRSSGSQASSGVESLMPVLDLSGRGVP